MWINVVVLIKRTDTNIMKVKQILGTNSFTKKQQNRFIHVSSGWSLSLRIFMLIKSQGHYPFSPHGRIDGNNGAFLRRLDMFGSMVQSASLQDFRVSRRTHFDNHFSRLHTLTRYVY
jgi:predicted neuraminidase